MQLSCLGRLATALLRKKRPCKRTLYLNSGQTFKSFFDDALELQAVGGHFLLCSEEASEGIDFSLR